MRIPSEARWYDLVAVGGWTLYDHIFQMQHYPRPGETVELLPDSVVNKTYWGDCVFNVAAVAAGLGLKVAVLSVVGNDFPSCGYPEALAKLGIESKYLTIDQRLPSGHSFLFSDPEGDGFCLSWRGASLFQDEYTPSQEPLKQAKIVVINEAFDGFTLAGAQGAADAGALIISNGMLGTADTELLDEYLTCIDLLCISEAEGKMLLERLGIETENDILSHGPRAVIVTHGARGSEVITADGKTQVTPVLTDRVVDVNGAGDSFVAGVATGLLRELPLIDAVRFGAGVASFVIEAVGCQTNLPTWEQAFARAFQDK